MSSRARPFCDDILPGLIVGRERECDPRKGRAKVNTDNELRLAAIRTLDLDGGVAPRVLRLRHAGRDAVRDVLLWHAVPRRCVERLLHSRLRVLHIGIDGGGVLDEGVLGVVGHWTRRTVRTRGGVARRSTQLLLWWRRVTVIHGQTRC